MWSGAGADHRSREGGVSRYAQRRRCSPAVIQEFYPDVAWAHLAHADFALQRWPEIPWVATNTDFSIRVDGGAAPGNGALVGAVEHAVGRPATCAGRPEKEIFDVVLERVVAHGDASMPGDSPARHSRRQPCRDSVHPRPCRNTVRTPLACDEPLRPSFVLQDVSEFYYPYPLTRQSEYPQGAHTVEVGGASVRRGNTFVRGLRAGCAIGLIRAAVAIVHDSGLPLDPLKIDPKIYSQTRALVSRVAGPQEDGRYSQSGLPPIFLKSQLQEDPRLGVVRSDLDFSPCSSLEHL